MRAPAPTAQVPEPSRDDQPRERPRVLAPNLQRPSLRDLLDLCARYLRPADLKLIRGAYAIADVAHAGVLRKSGEPYIEHPLAVASILAELAIDAKGIAAALLHDTVEDTSITLEQIEARFGPVIANIVDGVTKFTAVEAADDSTAPRDGRERKLRQQTETVRKLFLALGQDPRVVLLKLADRLHNMRTMDAMPPEKREATSHETLDIYVPLAGRVGLYLIKTELEDLAFSYLEPAAYARTVSRLADERMKSAAWARRMASRMTHELAARGIHAIVTWRTKRPYRAYQEAAESGMDVALLHDLVAFRVLTMTKDQCYSALGVIHHLWHPHDDRIRDYIATPKVNGYRSLHTAVFALDGRLAQIHIRTHAMHRAAQHGVATYWLERAAQGQSVDPRQPIRLDDLPGWVSQLATWHHELGLSAADFVATLRGDLLEEQIFVFTPKGEIRELPAGSTILDLAYAIHTKIGDHAAGAWVQTNSRQGVLVAREVPVSYVLRSGDVVSVVTDPAARPVDEWRDLARTRYAREKIARTLRVLSREGAGNGAAPPGGIDGAAQDAGFAPLRHPDGKSAHVELGRCCYPCPGDPIAGLAGRGRLVTVHRACCRTLRAVVARRRAQSQPHAEPLRVSWPEIQPITYRAYLSFVGQDHAGLMHELSILAARHNLNVSASRADANQSRYKAAVTLALDLPPGTRLDAVMRRFQTVPGIISVTRDTSKGCDKLQR
jgi:GTP pyrophosphokinase